MQIQASAARLLSAEVDLDISCFAGILALSQRDLCVRVAAVVLPDLSQAILKRPAAAAAVIKLFSLTEDSISGYAACSKV